MIGTFHSTQFILSCHLGIFMICCFLNATNNAEFFWYILYAYVYFKDSDLLYETEVAGPPQALCLYGNTGGKYYFLLQH